jgi:hypothetical protein
MPGGRLSYPRNPKQKKEERFVRGGADCEGALESQGSDSAKLRAANHRSYRR